MNKSSIFCLFNFLLICSIVSGELFFEHFCRRFAKDEYKKYYFSLNQNGDQVCKIVIPFMKSKLDSHKICESLSPFTVTSAKYTSADTLECIISPYYECHKAIEVPLGGNCYMFSEKNSCPSGYKTANLNSITIARWLAAMRNQPKTYAVRAGMHLNLEPQYSEKQEKSQNRIKVGLRGYTDRISMRGAIEKITNSTGMLCSSEKPPKKTALYYSNLCSLLEEVAHMKTTFENGHCFFLSMRRYSYVDMKKNDNEICKTIHEDAQNALYPSMDHVNALDGILKKMKKKRQDEEIFVLLPFTTRYEMVGKSKSVNVLQFSKNRTVLATHYFPYYFKDNKRTLIESSAFYLHKNNTTVPKYTHLESYVQAQVACAIGLDPTQFYEKERVCPKGEHRLRYSYNRIRCIFVSNRKLSFVDTVKECGETYQVLNIESIRDVDRIDDFMKKQQLGEVWIGLRRAATTPPRHYWAYQFRDTKALTTYPDVIPSQALQYGYMPRFQYFSANSTLDHPCVLHKKQKQKSYWETEPCAVEHLGICSTILGTDQWNPHIGEH